MSKELVICAAAHETRVAIVEDGQLCEIYVEREKEFALVGSIYKGRVTRVLPGMQSAFVDIGLDSDAFLYVSDFLEDLEEYDHVVSTAEGKVQKMEQEGGRVFAAATNGGAETAPAAEPSEAPPPAYESAPVASEAAAAPVSESIPEAPAAVPAHRSEDLPGEVRSATPGDAPPPSMSDARRDFRGGRGGFGRDRGGRGDRGDRGGRGGRGRFGRPGGGRFDRGGERRPGRDFPASKYASHRPYEPTPTEETSAPVSGEPIILPGESLAKYRERGPNAQPTEGNAAPPAEANLRVSPSPAAVFDELHAEAQVQEVQEHSAAPVTMESEPTVREHAFEAAAQAPPIETNVPPILPGVYVEEVPASTAPLTSEGPHGGAAEHDLTEEQTLHLAAQMAEVEQEEAEAARHAEMEAAAEEAAAEIEEGTETSAEEAEGEENGAPAGAYEADETDQEIRQGILDAAGDAQPEETNAQPAENRYANEQPSSARVGGRDQRPRFQRPMRRGGGGRRQGGRPQRGGRPQHYRGHQPPRRPQLISEMLKAGEEIIVQIAKEPLGKKGARITSHVALPGRYLVYMPTVEHIGVSRKINSADKRSRLRHLVAEAKTRFPGGFIVRTAAESATEDEIRTDIDFLGKAWQETVARAEQRKAPAILHRDLNLVERILRDHLSNDYTAIWIDNEEEYTKVLDFVGRFQPALVNRVKLYTKETPIFEELGIQQEIDKSLRPKVWLKSGGYIVINHTEALVAIDVNTGKFVGKGSTRLEDTIVRTNIEAVKEVVRQIRLRDLGGIIVVDFIDMEERRNREKVMHALEDALRSDRAPSKVLPFNEFGLVAITRKRTKQALERVLCQPCPYCTGSGMVKSLPTICYEIQAEARKMAGEVEGASLTLRVHPEIAKALKTRESALVEELEKWTRKSVIIQGDPTLHWEQYDIY